MQIKYVSTDEVIPYINNPRDNTDEAIEKVASSIKEFGFRSPIIVNGENTILCGHTRYHAAKRLKLDKIPIIQVKDLTPAQEKAYRIADNKISEYAKWNNELLTLELQELQEIEFDLNLTGFEGWELDNLINPISDEDLQDFFVEKEEKPKEPKKVQCPSCGQIIEV